MLLVCRSWWPVRGERTLIKELITVTLHWNVCRLPAGLEQDAPLIRAFRAALVCRWVCVCPGGVHASASGWASMHLHMRIVCMRAALCMHVNVYG